MKEEQVRSLLRVETEKAGSQLNWARKNRVSSQYVNMFLMGKRRPGTRLLSALGLVKRIDYVALE